VELLIAIVLVQIGNIFNIDQYVTVAVLDVIYCI